MLMILQVEKKKLTRLTDKILNLMATKHILLNRLNIEWMNQNDIKTILQLQKPYDMTVLIGVALVGLNNLNLNSSINVRSIYSGDWKW